MFLYLFFFFNILKPLKHKESQNLLQLQLINSPITEENLSNIIKHTNSILIYIKFFQNLRKRLKIEKFLFLVNKSLINFFYGKTIGNFDRNDKQEFRFN